jgi:hypothetical protein
MSRVCAKTLVVIDNFETTMAEIEKNQYKRFEQILIEDDFEVVSSGKVFDYERYKSILIEDDPVAKHYKKRVYTKRNNLPPQEKIPKKRGRKPNPENANKRKKRAGKARQKVTRSCFTELPYDNDALPNVRFPCDYSVPDHLLEEFKYMFPNNPTKKKQKLVPSRPIGSRQYEFLSWVRKFWTLDMLCILVNIILKKGTCVTFTYMDWLCTNYSKNLNIHYRINDDPFDFFIHESYQQNLREFYRVCFDAFARKMAIIIEFVDEKNIFSDIPESDLTDTLDIRWDKKRSVGYRRINGKTMIYLSTSVGQLIFFHWAITHKVLDFCEDHAYEIKEHMLLKKGKPTNSTNLGKRRSRLSESKSTWSIEDVSVVMKFDRVTRSFKAVRGNQN